MAAQGDIEAADREFAVRMENLRRVAAQWSSVRSRPKSRSFRRWSQR